jgi:conjugal transfer pilus assembly protein TrbC
MPKTLLNQYDKIARHLGAKLVIRGLKNNSFKETIAYIKEINAQGTVIEINPQRFKEFEINLVPAFVITDGNKASPKFDKLIGNVSIVYAIEKFVSQGDLSILAKGYSEKLVRLDYALK